MNSENIPKKPKTKTLSQKSITICGFRALLSFTQPSRGAHDGEKKEVTRICRHGCVIAGSVLNGSAPVDYTNEIWL